MENDATRIAGTTRETSLIFRTRILLNGRRPTSTPTILRKISEGSLRKQFGAPGRLRRPDKSTGVPVARDTSLSTAKANGAGDRPRTGYLNLGKVALYQVSYARSCGFRFYVFSTTPSDSGAASATTDRTSAEYSSTRAR